MSAALARPTVAPVGIWSTLVLCVWLAGCASLPPPVSDPEQVWREREAQLLGLDHWAAVGRLALRTEEE